MLEREADASFCIWWVVVGILSSVGMGSGLHTGMLWLFPHIYIVVTTANQLGHFGFDPRENRWCLPAFLRSAAPGIAEEGTFSMINCKWEFNSTVGADVNGTVLFDKVGDSYVAPFWDLYAQLWLTTFLWGLGTALGESPPFFVARAGASLHPCFAHSLCFPDCSLSYLLLFCPSCDHATKN